MGAIVTRDVDPDAATIDLVKDAMVRAREVYMQGGSPTGLQTAKARAAIVALQNAGWTPPQREKCPACRGTGLRFTRETHGGNPEPSQSTCYLCSGDGWRKP